MGNLLFGTMGKIDSDKPNIEHLFYNVKRDSLQVCYGSVRPLPINPVPEILPKSDKVGYKCASLKIRMNE
jgi:hypothetical protein